MKIPKPTIKRLGLYYRCLLRYKEAGIKAVSSSDIAENLGLKSTLVRRDLSYFGDFGKKGYGYDVENLVKEIENIIGVHKEWNVVVIGAGNIGTALVNYKGLSKNNFNIVAVVDSDPVKVGRKIVNITVEPVDKLKELKEKLNIEIAVIAVPETAAQLVANEVERLGFSGIVNFSPVKLKTKIPVEDVDITLSFQALVYHIQKKGN